VVDRITQFTEVIGGRNLSVTTTGVKRIVMDKIFKEEMIATSTMFEALTKCLTVNENDDTILLLMAIEEAQLIIADGAILRTPVDSLTCVIRVVGRDRDRDRDRDQDQGRIIGTTVKICREAGRTHHHLVLSHHLLFPVMKTNF